MKKELKKTESDERIIELYWQRDEDAIRETDRRYGRYLHSIACHILRNREDGHETVNDTYLKAWHSMPPHRPARLSCFLAKITRDLSIDRFRRQNAAKRQGSQYTLSLEELAECVEGGENPQEQIELAALAEAIGTYIRSCPKQTCDIFICRYYFLDPIGDIAGFFGVSQSLVKSVLHRTRIGLRSHLEKEGFAL